MQLLFKDEREMTKEEKTKLEMMRALSVLFHKADLTDGRKNYDLTGNSNKFTQASILMDRFEIKLKDKAAYKTFHKKTETTFPGDSNFDVLYREKTKEKMSALDKYVQESLFLLDKVLVDA